MSASTHADAVELLSSWHAPDTAQDNLRRDYLAHLRALGEDALRRDGSARHVTASCLVFDTAFTRTLLVLHRKGGVWVQPGGHVEVDDSSLAAAAVREVAEETGVRVDLGGLADLHHHELGAAFGSCTGHLDVTFWATASRSDSGSQAGSEADPEADPRVSPESDAVAWWPLAALPAGVVDDLPARLDALRARVGRR